MSPSFWAESSTDCVLYITTNKFSNKILCMHVHGNITHNIQNIKKEKNPNVHQLMNKQNSIFPNNMNYLAKKG
jgi:hypothetical protein